MVWSTVTWVVSLGGQRFWPPQRHPVAHIDPPISRRRQTLLLLTAFPDKRVQMEVLQTKSPDFFVTSFICMVYNYSDIFCCGFICNLKISIYLLYVGK